MCLFSFCSFSGIHRQRKHRSWIEKNTLERVRMWEKERKSVWGTMNERFFVSVWALIKFIWFVFIACCAVNCQFQFYSASMCSYGYYYCYYKLELKVRIFITNVYTHPAETESECEREKFVREERKQYNESKLAEYK